MAKYQIKEEYSELLGEIEILFDQHLANGPAANCECYKRIEDFISRHKIRTKYHHQRIKDILNDENDCTEEQVDKLLNYLVEKGLVDTIANLIYSKYKEDPRVLADGQLALNSSQFYRDMHEQIQLYLWTTEFGSL